MSRIRHVIEGTTSVHEFEIVSCKDGFKLKHFIDDHPSYTSEPFISYEEGVVERQRIIDSLNDRFTNFNY